MTRRTLAASLRRRSDQPRRYTENYESDASQVIEVCPVQVFATYESYSQNVVTSFLLAFSLISQEAINPQLAARFFQETKWACQDDGGALWGHDLSGPIVFVERQSRQAVLSEKQEGFKELNGVWTGVVPKEIGIANTAFDWNGKKWTMVMWPLPENRGERSRLVLHELFHRIQDELGLPAAAPRNEHMDKQLGRLWLQLEGRALNSALNADPDHRGRAIEDALTFRAKRQSLFVDAKAEEDALELNEGLAEFTGLILKGGWEPEARTWLARQIHTSFEDQDTYSRSFAYRTGPAYSFLLNLEETRVKKEVTWRGRLTMSSSLADMLAEVVSFKPLANDAESRAVTYGLDELTKREEVRETKRLEQQSRYTKQLVEGPVLVIPFKSGNFQYDPYNVFMFGERGTVYPTCTLIDDWGTLTVTGGVLIAKDYKTAWVSAPKTSADTEGPGWTLKLNPAWKIVAGARKGDYTLKKSLI